MGAGTNSEDICTSFLIMNNNNTVYKNLEFTWEDNNIDYYIIISYLLDEFHIPERSIIFQMEPWVYDDTKQWGVKMWGDWTKPDKTKYMHVRNHLRYLNPAQWFFVAPKEININRKNKLIAVISAKVLDTGHINRVNFIRYVETQGLDIIDVYGYENYHNFRNYKGTLDDKTIMEQYKYVFSVENNNEYNYATEKIWESFISCSLCFYDGCPNLYEYINPLAYVAIDCTKQEKTLNVIQTTIDRDEWSTRLPYLKKAKDKTINEYNALEIVYQLVNQNTHIV